MTARTVGGAREEVERAGLLRDVHDPVALRRPHRVLVIPSPESQTRAHAACQVDGPDLAGGAALSEDRGRRASLVGGQPDVEVRRRLADGRDRGPAAVVPHQLCLKDRRSPRIDQGALGGSGERGVTCARIVMHALGNHDGLSRDPELACVERHGNQVLAAHHQQVAGWRVGDARGIGQDLARRLFAVQRRQEHAAVLHSRVGVVGPRHEQIVPAVGQEARPAVAAVGDVRIGLGELAYRSARGVDDVDPGVGVRREEDLAARAPGAAARVGGVGHRLHAAGRHLGAFDLARGEEPHVSAVRRPEDVLGPVGVGQRPRTEVVDRAQPEAFSAVVVHDAEHDRPAVGRERGRCGQLVDVELRRAGYGNHQAHRRRRPGRGRDPADGEERREQQRNARHGPRDPRCALHGPNAPLVRDRLVARLGNPLQLERQVARRLPALGRLLGHAASHEPVEGARGHRRQAGNRSRIFLEDRGDQAGLAFALEGPLCGQHLVQQGAEGEDVAARVGLLPLELLGRHVLKRADDHPLRGQRRGHRRRRGQIGAAARPGQGRASQAEVEQLGARLRQHDVARLEIAVDHPLAVGRGQRVGDLRPVLQRLIGSERALGQAVGQRPALEVLHHQVVHTAVLADVVQRADVGVVQVGDRPRLALESLPRLGLVGQVARKHLDRHGPVEPRVARPVDLAHTASAQGVDDLVRPEPGAGIESHVLYYDVS